jgi:hypothetical protein
VLYLQKEEGRMREQRRIVVVPSHYPKTHTQSRSMMDDSTVNTQGVGLHIHFRLINASPYNATTHTYTTKEGEGGFAVNNHDSSREEGRRREFSRKTKRNQREGKKETDRL